MSLRFLKVLALTVLTTGLLSACACPECDQPPPPPVSQPVWPFVQMAPVPPPPPLAETVSVPDVPSQYLWRGGYWIYDGRNFQWIPGVLMDRPSPTAVWSPDHWVRHTYGWVFQPGFWQ